MLDGGASVPALLPAGAQAAVFAAAIFVLNATPGVDVLLTVSRTLAGGARAGAAAALGITAGCVVHALGAAFGLAALIALYPAALHIVQWAGAAYLAWLGVGMLGRAWRAAPDAPAVPKAATRSGLGEWRVGLLSNLLNPKMPLFFLAFLPQFVPAATPSRTVSLLLLGAWFSLQSLLFLLVLVALAARLGQASASERLRRWTGAAGGLLFVGLALRLLRERPAGA